MTQDTEKSFEGLKKLYNDIFKLSLEVASIVSLENIQRIMQVNQKKDKLIKKAHRIKTSLVLKENEKREIENLITKIKNLESKNIEKITKLKDQVAQDLAGLNKGITLAGAYKSKNESKSRLVDLSE